MDFYAVLDQVLKLLRQRGRVTYNALKRQCGLDDACLQDLKDEIIEEQRVAVDEDGRILVWTGDVAAPAPPASEPAMVQVRPPDAESRGSARPPVWRDAVRRPGSTHAKPSTWLGSTKRGPTRRSRCTSLAPSIPMPTPRCCAGRSPLPAGPDPS